MNKIQQMIKDGVFDGESLRKAEESIYHVAIDGPVASGKGTVAKGLSNRLRIPCLDTGAMYRAFAVYMMDKGYEDSEIDKALEEFDLDTRVAEKTYVSVNGLDVTHRIRDEEISMKSSYLSSYPQVRDKMVALQREIAKENSFILEGRDIASVVLPDAKYKFYLTAHVKTRAMRRWAENQVKGIDITLKEMIKQIKERDRNDMNKPVGALKCVEGAIRIDNTKLNREQTVDKIMEIIRNQSAE